jgi:oligopeptide/dipeptide ABC transporter ATP-binding protein
MTSMNPVYTVGKQIIEAMRPTTVRSARRTATGAIELLDAVGIPDADRRVDNYPHEFSGGMRQRAMIAMGLALEPSVLIADEPTTALDVTIQAQILDLIQDLNKSRGLATILITHDLGVVAEVADRVLVMYGGKVVERGTLDDIFYDPQHPYTWGLLGSLTRIDRPRPQRLPQISGAAAPLLNLPSGCSFRTPLPARVPQVPRGAGARGAPRVLASEPPRPLLADEPSRRRIGAQVEPDRIGLRPEMSDARRRLRRPLLEVTTSQALPDQDRPADRRSRPGARRRRVSFERQQRRNAGRGRRVGVGQVDGLPGRAAAC